MSPVSILLSTDLANLLHNRALTGHRLRLDPAFAYAEPPSTLAFTDTVLHFLLFKLKNNNNNNKLLAML